ncbi:MULTISPECIES: YrhB domain-containing protein [Streptomyces]|uniref:YrhB domain-containing protein n=1 Tax=Streptomyces TaxID=1883 RepID=UPI00116484FE|nr:MULTISPECIES: YrhB domain-containing protein [unclassified Streptomyces]NMI61423.1 serine protease [Streptomyces sp. RLA2-12]QDN60518.1 serine protease [Streptomyces sp. S1D4-20]QDN70573.1 serine protease [Streptomyces sp. S1D4-14]QDO53029.1 serine protease [Streptomyces sp. RLB3-5]QDO63272.1 serine protease [Streptomyces sp. RLB1-8]
MLSKSEAVELAAEFVRAMYPDKVASLVMLPDKCEEYGFGWAVRFDWKEHLETGNPVDAPFTSVVVVPHHGEAAHWPPSALPVAEYMRRREVGDWPSVDRRSGGY